MATQQIEVVDANAYMPRINDVHLPCQWLNQCDDGKCPAFRKRAGNFYCAKKQI